nr:hypothetical protein BaRGS_030139 [Batillaria attramentaria]
MYSVQSDLLLRADWLGIHEKICSSLMILRQPVPFLPSEEERQKREDEMRMERSHMVNLTRTTGQKLLFEGKHEQAVPAAMQSLRFAIDVYGIASIELVPSYLILGEASIDDIRTSGGYFHMANVFFRQGRRDVADSLYRQAKEFGRKAVVASDNNPDENFSRNIVEL